METNENQNNTLNIKTDEDIIKLKIGGKDWIYKKSLRPSRSVKPFSFSRNKFKSSLKFKERFILR